MKVTLDWIEVAMASRVGTIRHIENLRRGVTRRFNVGDDTGWGSHIEGALGENAVAKARNVYLRPTINTYKRVPDLCGWEIRTRTGEWTDMPVRDNDKPDAPVVLVLRLGHDLSGIHYDVVGWMLAREAKRDEWLKDHGDYGRPSWFVPMELLHSIETLVVGEEQPQQG